MSDLLQACKSLEAQGLMNQVGENSFKFTGDVDEEKLAELEENYAKDFDVLYRARRAKEIEADRKWRGKF